MRCLVIGYGSIGKKHAEILLQLKFYVALVTSQKVDIFKCYSSVESAFNDDTFDYIVIANATFSHHETFLQLIQCHYSGIVLVEKPLFSKIEKLPEHSIKKIIVAYNLRFHELLRHTKNILNQEKIISFSAYVGQYLPTWRKEIDYRQCYSASKELGGGVLRDLSHELDYSTWLCGRCLDVTAMGGQLSLLEITSDDVYSILMKCESAPIVNLQLNYLDRISRREILVHTEQSTLWIDFIKGTLSINGKIEKSCVDGVRQSYVNQHEAILKGEFEHFCDYDHGLEVVRLIDVIESTSKSKSWMTV